MMRNSLESTESSLASEDTPRMPLRAFDELDINSVRTEGVRELTNKRRICEL